MYCSLGAFQRTRLTSSETRMMHHLSAGKMSYAFAHHKFSNAPSMCLVLARQVRQQSAPASDSQVPTKQEASNLAIRGLCRDAARRALALRPFGQPVQVRRSLGLSEEVVQAKLHCNESLCSNELAVYTDVELLQLIHGTAPRPSPAEWQAVGLTSSSCGGGGFAVCCRCCLRSRMSRRASTCCTSD